MASKNFRRCIRYENQAACKFSRYLYFFRKCAGKTGEIVNIDGNCNRVASLLYGHEKVYLVIGRNKIRETYEEALFRARNIAAPLNAKRVGAKTPCAVKADKCYDCNSSQRICRGLCVLWAPPMTGEYVILLINEDLGY